MTANPAIQGRSPAIGDLVWHEAIDIAETMAQVHDVLDKAFASIGADVFSYHVVTDGLRSFSFLDSLKICTFPEAWVKHYADTGAFFHDPIIDHAATATEPYRWFDVLSQDDLNDEQRMFLDEVREAGFVDGWGVPVFGPGMLTGYFGVGSRQSMMELTRKEIFGLHALCQRAHLALFRLMTPTGTAPPVALSPRESEILMWIARGKTNEEIGIILASSPHTVNAHLRRIFAKFDTTNRIEAVLYGFQHGILEMRPGRDGHPSLDQVRRKPAT